MEANLRKKTIGYVIAGSLVLAIFVGALGLFLHTDVHAEEDNPWKSFGVFQPPVKRAANFTLPDLQGKEVTLDNLRGKVVFINFWATWCYACKIEMPSMDKLYKKYKGDNFELLGIDLLEPKKKVVKFINELGVTFPILLDSKGALRRDYPVPGLPITYIVDKKGNLRGRVFGSREWDKPEIETILLELLKE